MVDSSPYLIVWILVVVISYLCSLHVLYTIRSLQLRSIPSMFIVVIHITQIMEDISTTPNIFINPTGLCSFMGFFHNYSQIAQVVACFMITYYLHDMVVDDMISK